MSLHSIIEPAGTLMTGWKLVPQRDSHAADLRNENDAPLEVARAPAPAENAPAVRPASMGKSERKLGEVG